MCLADTQQLLCATQHTQNPETPAAAGFFQRRWAKIDEE